MDDRSFDPVGEDRPAGLIDITDRLVLREFSPEESELCRNIYIGCDCMPDWDPAKMPPAEFEEFHRAYVRYQYGFYGYGNWGVFLKAPGCSTPDEYAKKSDTIIGVVGIINGSASGTGEISYAILPAYRRQGYAFEACTAALEYGRECGFERFEAKIEPANIPSLGLARKLGIAVIPV